MRNITPNAERTAASTMFLVLFRLRPISAAGDEIAAHHLAAAIRTDQRGAHITATALTAGLIAAAELAGTLAHLISEAIVLIVGGLHAAGGIKGVLCIHVKAAMQLDAAREKELKRIAEDSVRRAERRAKLVAKGKDVSALDREDSLAAIRNQRVMREMVKDSLPQDSLENKLPEAQQQQEEKKTPSLRDADSIYRLVKAYRNVKMFRSDAQMVCDSLVSNSVDSIIRLYIEPVMWNQANQLAAEQVDVFTSNSKLDKAEFKGDPIMIAEIDTAYYNQVAGRTMTALFKDNAIYRNDVDGNVQTIYFRTETEDSPLVVEMTYLESASASFFIEEQQLVGITYRNNVPFTMYPLALIPESQPTKLKNFKWVPELRPTKEMVFNRTLRPSEREERTQRRRPTFSIVERMDRYKERLIMSGDWEDREDQLTPELIEWRNRNLQK